ncbi:MAG: carbon-nitrogen hydrolase family protein [Mangrovicoccus sp.]
MRTALIQMCSSDDPTENAGVMREAIRQASAEGAGFILTPEVCNCLSPSRKHQHAVLRVEAEDPTLPQMQEEAARAGIWLLLGSLALKSGDPDGRFVNRSFLIDPTGSIVARYDKIHMFDVELGDGESYRESSGYRPGDRAVTYQTSFGKIGLSICYDLRFPQLFRALAKSGAEIITVPAAFSPTTGVAHWMPLLTARAIENGVFILAPAQFGEHKTQIGSSRRTYGHSCAISPWGELLAQASDKFSINYLFIDVQLSATARMKIPSLSHERFFEGPL